MSAWLIIPCPMSTSLPHSFFLRCIFTTDIPVTSKIMPFKATFAAITVVATGLWVVCASVFATAGWTAPACLAAEVASGVGVVLAAITDIKGSKKSQGTHVDRLRRTDEPIYRLHDNGWLEHYQGRMGELYGTNESVQIVNMESGYLHQARMWNKRLVVRTDMKQVPFTFGRNTTNRHRPAEAPVLGKPETFLSRNNKRITSSESNVELSSLFISGSNPGTATVDDTSALNNFAGQSIANQAYKLGTWCMTLSSGSVGARRLAILGLTLTGPKYAGPGDQEACSG